MEARGDRGRDFNFGETRQSLLRSPSRVLLSFSFCHTRASTPIVHIPMTVGARVLERIRSSHRGVIYTILFDHLHDQCTRPFRAFHLDKHGPQRSARKLAIHFRESCFQR